MPAGRRCPRCPTIITNGARYCPACAAQYERTRGSAAQRGYGAGHREKRAAIVREMWQGKVIRCIDCGVVLTPTTFDLGHTEDRRGYRGAQCSRCNRSDGGRRGAAIRNGDPGG